MQHVKLKDIDTRAPEGTDKDQIKQKFKEILKDLDELQNLMYAESKHSLLIIIQGMDASGKDGLTRDVMSSMNPQGVFVQSFKEPVAEELAHDFLWRVHRHTPPKGIIQVFNRSHYEDVLITRVHGTVDDVTAHSRMKAINDFERLLKEHNNTTILKFYLHLSHREQYKRLKARMDKPQKMWKYNEEDFKESKLWKQYMNCYEDVFKNCSEIPWHIIPSDQNWYKSFLIASYIRNTMQGLNMRFPGMKKSK